MRVAASCAQPQPFSLAGRLTVSVSLTGACVPQPCAVAGAVSFAGDSLALASTCCVPTLACSHSGAISRALAGAFARTLSRGLPSLAFAHRPARAAATAAPHAAHTGFIKPGADAFACSGKPIASARPLALAVPSRVPALACSHPGAISRALTGALAFLLTVSVPVPSCVPALACS